MKNARSVTYEQLLDWLRLIDEGLMEQRGYLTELDSAIGDGDHGTNLARGAAAGSAKVDAEKPEYIDELFRMVGMTLISSVGGASGPLYGTFFLRFSLSAGHRKELSAEQLADALEAGVAGVAERGKPELGDKTMYDAMLPAVRAFRAGIGGGLAAAAEAASRQQPEWTQPRTWSLVRGERAISATAVSVTSIPAPHPPPSCFRRWRRRLHKVGA